MNDWMAILLQSIVLVLALSADTFVAGFSYGANRIGIPLASAGIVNLVCSAALGVSLLAGMLAGEYIPQGLAGIICFALLFALGLSKVFDSAVKSLIRKSGVRREIEFSAMHLRFILMVYADPQQADSDLSKRLSVSEAMALGAALSLDGLAVGFGAALTDANAIQITLLSFVMGMLAMVCGSRLGQRISERITANISWLGGAMLILLALFKL